MERGCAKNMASFFLPQFKKLDVEKRRDGKKLDVKKRSDGLLTDPKSVPKILGVPKIFWDSKKSGVKNGSKMRKMTQK